jgi:predicted transcriptional regulator
VQQGKTLGTWLPKCLECLNLEDLCEWDALAFIYRHGASLASAEQIARFLGQPAGRIGAALEKLEARGLIERSRASQGIRLYQYVMPTDPERCNCFQELMSFAESRSGRVALMKELQQFSNGKRTNAQHGARSPDLRRKL